MPLAEEMLDAAFILFGQINLEIAYSFVYTLLWKWLVYIFWHFQTCLLFSGQSCHAGITVIENKNALTVYNSQTQVKCQHCLQYSMANYVHDNYKQIQQYKD